LRPPSQASLTQIAITVVANFSLVCVLAGFISKLFNPERIHRTV
jgi:hypothetical protein